MSEKPKVLTVLTEFSGQEAIYVDGVLAFRDDTVYACDIVQQAGDGPVLIRHESCEFSGDHWEWPENLGDVPLSSSGV